MKKNEQKKASEIFNVADLVSDLVAERAEPEELHALDAWLAETPRNKELLKEICSDQTMQEKIQLYRESDAEKAFEAFAKKREQRTGRRSLRRILAGAAITTLLIGSGSLFILQQNDKQAQPVTKTMQTESTPTPRKPLLTLSDGTRMNVWGEGIRFEESAKGQQVLWGDSLLSHQEDSKATDRYNLLEVPVLCDFRFTLSDGTKVWMNAASTLRYPEKFAADSRTVYASGELYLEVAKDAERPFYVVVDGMKIKVLGTAFNVRAYPHEEETEITLTEGKVTAQVNNREYTLTPGEQLELEESSREVNIYAIDINDVLSWTKGYYVFKKTHLQEVASTLRNWYNVTIKLTSPASRTTTYTGVINKEEKIEVFLKRLAEVSDIRWERENNVINIY